MQQATELRIGVGIDTARYGHHASFLRPDRQAAAPPLEFSESAAGYQQLREVIERLQRKHAACKIHVHIDAAGQYAANLEGFLRTLDQVSVSVGEPKRNKDYHAAVSPKRKTDATEGAAMARFAVAELPPETAGLPTEFLALREVTARLKVKVRDVTRSVNRLHNLLARVFPELAGCVPNIAVSWVLTLLAKYPTPERISRARRATLARIPYATDEKLAAVQQAAAESVGSFRGAAAESLICLAVEEVRQAVEQQKTLEKLLEQAFTALPPSGHSQLTTIPGIGLATAAVLTSKIVSLERFANAEKLVGYFGVFPRETSSGVDRQGNPNPSKTRRMSQQGNDLVRSYLYSAAKTAARCNPAVRSLYQRLRARGKRTDVALGHCMRKLLHLVFAVWATNKPFDPNHYPWESDCQAETQSAANTKREEDACVRKEAVGRNPDVSPDRSAVTTAEEIVSCDHESVNSNNGQGGSVDFAWIRSQITIERILEHLHVLENLRPSSGELRGPCPIHSTDARPSRKRHFAANLGKNVFHCFSCGAQGNQLDLWAAVHQQDIYTAALDLARTFHLEVKTTEKRSP